MKITGSRKVHYESGPDMTPLVDVVMVLLIFLMMVGKFGGQNRYLISDMPITSSGPAQAPVDPSQVPKQDITINVTSPTPDQFRAFYGRTVNATTQDDLSTQLAALLKEKTAAGTPLDDIQVFIKPTRNVKYANIVRVYTAVLQAGYTKVGFQTSEG